MVGGAADRGILSLLRVAEALRIGTPASRLVAAGAFALSPRVLTTVGSISSKPLPVMLAPWVLLPVIRALDAESVLRAAGAGGRCGCSPRSLGSPWR